MRRRYLESQLLASFARRVLCCRAKGVVISRDRVARLKKVVGACLALLISLSTFSSTALQLLAASSASKCCRTKCCCRKKQAAGERASAAFSARSCAANCGQSDLAAISAKHSLLTQAKAYELANQLFSGRVYSDSPFIGLISHGCELRQRPPPLKSVA